MGFKFKFTQFFLKQWKDYDKKTNQQIQDKLHLIRQNPFRFPKHAGYKFVFKVKISISQKYSRLMYAVFMPDSSSITVLGVFARGAGYKDFERIFKYLRK